MRARGRKLPVRSMARQDINWCCRSVRCILFWARHAFRSQLSSSAIFGGQQGLLIDKCWQPIYISMCMVVGIDGHVFPIDCGGPCLYRLTLSLLVYCCGDSLTSFQIYLSLTNIYIDRCCSNPSTCIYSLLWTTPYMNVFLPSFTAEEIIDYPRIVYRVRSSLFRVLQCVTLLEKLHPINGIDVGAG